MFGARKSIDLLFLALAASQQSFAQTHVEQPAAVGGDRCLSLPVTAQLEDAGAIIINSARVEGNSTVQPWGACDNAPVPVTAPLCRVQFTVKTSNSSEVNAEAWLPDEWFGRSLSVGLGHTGIGGCIDYGLLNYGSSFHFASFSTNGGLDGDQGRSYYQQPEMVHDYAGRSIHAVTEIGKQLVEKYYAEPHSKSYFIGCSTGGRQGIWSAQHWPEDFDGILAGAPTMNWNWVIGALGLISRFTGYPEGPTSPSHIPRGLWEQIRAETIKQCDLIDGIEDGIIEDGEECYHPLRLAVLRCPEFKGRVPGVTCLTDPQMDTLFGVYSAIQREHGGEVLYPGSNFGANPADIFDSILHGGLFHYVDEWWKNVIYEDPSYDLGNFSLTDILYAADQEDPYGLNEVSGEFSDFHAHGGKLITYVGSHDGIIPLGVPKGLYNLTVSTMNQTVVDDFYRLFVIPGMDHCGTPNSEGPFMIGHGFPLPPQNDTDHNALLALVDWVEGGKAVETIVGTSTAGEERALSKFEGTYAIKNILPGSEPA